MMWLLSYLWVGALSLLVATASGIEKERDGALADLGRAAVCLAVWPAAWIVVTARKAKQVSPEHGAVIGILAGIAFSTLCWGAILLLIQQLA